MKSPFIAGVPTTNELRGTFELKLSGDGGGDALGLELGLALALGDALGVSSGRAGPPQAVIRPPIITAASNRASIFFLVIFLPP